MDIFQQVFEHLPEFGVIVCRTCRYAVLQSHIAGHLSAHHAQSVPARKRLTVQQASHELHGLIAQHKNQVRYPEAATAALEQLPVFHNGLGCTECSFVCQSRSWMQEHLNKRHNIKKRPGRALSARDSSTSHIRSDVHYQCFFVRGAGRRFFEVERQTDRAANRERSGSLDDASWEALGRQTWQDAAAEHAQGHESVVIEDQFSRTKTDSWLRRTGWQQHLAGWKADALLQFLRNEADSANDQGDKPRSSSGSDSSGDDDDDDDKAEDADIVALAVAVKATQRTIRAGFLYCRSNVSGVAALQVVNRRETTGALLNNERPLYVHHKVQTIRRYYEVWTNVLRYAWRTAELQKRPPYRLARQQQQAFERLRSVCRRGDQTSEQRQGLLEATSRFWIAVLDDELSDDAHKNVLISGLAVLGINPTTKQFWMAQDYTPKLSAVVTVARVLVVQHAWLRRQAEISELAQGGASAEEAEDEAVSVERRTRDMVSRFMTLAGLGRGPSPLSHVLHLRTFGMKIRFTTAAAGRVLWQGQEIRAGPVNFTMDDLRALVHNLLHTARTRLLEEIFCDCVPPGVALSALYDQPAQVSPGFSFVRDARNAGQLQGGEQWLLRQILGQSRLRRRFVQARQRYVSSAEASSPGPGSSQPTSSTVAGSSAGTTSSPGAIIWRDGRIAAWFAAEKRFKEELFALVHLTGGAPPRGSEILSIRHRDSVDGAQRGVFVEDGLVSFVTTYHKNYSATGKAKTVFRFVPEEVSQLVVWWLWLVRPFVEHLKKVWSRYEGCRAEGDWMWEPRAEERLQLDEREGDEADSGADDIVAGDAMPRDEIEREQEAALGQSESSSGGAPRNADGVYDTDRIRRILLRETQTRIGQRITTSLWRHLYVAIHRNMVQDRRAGETLRELYEPDAEGAGDQVGEVTGATGAGPPSLAAMAARQAGHGVRIEEMIYGRSMLESPFATLTERLGFRLVSEDWHRFLRFPSALRRLASTQHEITQEAVERQLRQERFERWRALRQVDVHEGLRQLVGTEATFRGVQRPALEAIVRSEMSVVVVMGTGGGKSLLFMLPALLSSGLTVVVVPLISLRQDLVRRCEEAHLRFFEWRADVTAGSVAYDTKIVFITPEATQTGPFLRFLDVISATHRLDRIVVDECHTLLDADDRWRPALLQLRRLATYEVPMIWQTATLPPRDQARWGERAGVDLAQSRIFRCSTTRPNIRYAIVPYDVAAEDETIEELVARQREKYRDGSVVIYCERVAQVERLGKVLRCPVFHRQAGSEAEKREIVRRLVRNEAPRALVATNALGLGIDAPRIRTVIHVGVRRQMRDFAQESGRTSRDGAPGEAIVLRGLSVDRRGRPRLVPLARETEAGMAQFVDDCERCRRQTLDEWIDGRDDREGCQAGEVSCDVCERRAQGVDERRDTDEDGDGDGDGDDSEEESEKESVGGEGSRGEMYENSALSSSESMGGQAWQPNSWIRGGERENELDLDGEDRRRGQHQELATRERVLALADADIDTDRDGDHDAVSVIEDEGIGSAASSPAAAGREEQELLKRRRAETNLAVFEEQQREASQRRGTERRREIEMQQKVGRLADEMGEWVAGCVRCRAAGAARETWSSHQLGGCADEEGRIDIEQSTAELMQHVEMEPYSGCFRCGLPFVICGGWGANGRGGWQWQSQSRGCRFLKRTLYSAVAAVLWAEDTIGARITREAGGSSREAWTGWLGARRKWGDDETTGMCEVLTSRGAFT